MYELPITAKRLLAPRHREMLLGDLSLPSWILVMQRHVLVRRACACVKSSLVNGIGSSGVGKLQPSVSCVVSHCRPMWCRYQRHNQMALSAYGKPQEQHDQ